MCVYVLVCVCLLVCACVWQSFLPPLLPRLLINFCNHGKCETIVELWAVTPVSHSVYACACSTIIHSLPLQGHMTSSDYSVTMFPSLCVFDDSLSIPLSPFSLDLSTAMKYASFKKQSTVTHPPQQTFLLWILLTSFLFLLMFCVKKRPNNIEQWWVTIVGNMSV